MVIGPCQLVPPSCDLNSTTPGLYVFRKATYTVPHPQPRFVSVATLIWGSNCHPTPLQANPHTNCSGPHVVPPSVDSRDSTLVPGQPGEHWWALIPVMSW